MAIDQPELVQKKLANPAKKVIAYVIGCLVKLDMFP